MKNYHTKKVDKDGDVTYYYNKKGQFHRIDGPAIEYKNGSKYWYINGKLHNKNGPAVVYSYGDKFWFIDNKKHREDGPAIEYKNGNKSWYIDDTLYSKETFLYLTKYKEKYNYQL